MQISKPEPRIAHFHQFDLAQSLLKKLMAYRRTAGPNAACLTPSCQYCQEPHLPKVISAIALGLPLTFVLPAFPGKSPNLNKVLGTLPDLAEQKALEFLHDLCQRIQRDYPPGARIILCADGRVFSDVIGMRDEDVTAYQLELERMITSLGLTSLSTFHLDELYRNETFQSMRIQLMEQHGQPLVDLHASVRRGGKIAEASIEDQEAHRLYCGMTRFLLEDSMFPGQTKSRTALQKECRARAYQVMQRSKAWGELLEIRFPNAVRLSIHPQSCGAQKLGLRLMDADTWMTPWHGVAVEVGGHFVLMKRHQAEALGAQLIFREGRPSHYVLENDPPSLKLKGLTHEA